MKIKTIERFITCVALILLSYAVCGCREKAEATEPNEPHDAMTICDKCPHFGWSEEPKPNEPKLTYTIEELDEIYKDEPALGKLAKRLWGFGEPEPNEPEESELHIICDCGMKYDIRGKELCYKSRYTFLTDFVKAINPKSKIPTWPEYIELEKDLYIDISSRVRDPEKGRTWNLVKGTKIYFKDD